MSSNEGNSPHPFVFWAQNKSHLWLRVDLKDVKNPDIQVNENCIKFSATGIGARGNLLYEFDLELYSNINPLQSQYRITARQIDISLKKEKDGWWARLTSDTMKLTWLKIDFDKWRSEDDEDEEMNSRTLDSLKELEDEIGHETPKIDLEKLKKIYLFIYNLWQFLGFLYIFLVLCIKYAQSGAEFLPTAYHSIDNVLKFCQLMQMLEILHPLFGYTKGSVTEAVIQVGGRFIILFGLIEAEPRIQPMPVVFYLVVCWSLVEVFRYPFYMARTYGRDIAILTWLRYTVWIPLYPLGFLCEGVVILRNIPFFEETEKFSVSLPNAWNFAFHYPTLMRIYLLFFFLPAMYVMMSHMQRQRVQKLGESKNSKKKSN